MEAVSELLFNLGSDTSDMRVMDTLLNSLGSSLKYSIEVSPHGLLTSENPPAWITSFSLAPLRLELQGGSNEDR